MTTYQITVICDDEIIVGTISATSESDARLLTETTLNNMNIKYEIISIVEGI